MTTKPDFYFAVPGDISRLTGGYAYARQLLAALREAGHVVTHLQLPSSFPFPDQQALAAAHAIFSALPDGAVVLVDGLAFGAMDVIAQRHAQRLQLIALCHHPLALETGLTRATANALQRSEQTALAAAVAVVVTSNMTRTILMQDFAVPAEKIVVAVPGTEPQRFAPCTGDPPVLVSVATLTRRKGHDVLISALASLSHLPWVARFVGGTEFDVEWTVHLRKLVADNGLGERIHFVGGVADPSSEYAHADIFVLPSLYEGYGMVFAEALAFGLPIVGTSAGAVPEVVPTSAGILVPPSDIDALAAALRKVLTDPLCKTRLQHGAQQAAAQLPRWHDTARVITELVKRVNKQ
jgi:glycosyltransferase involved in cell wall biosynthesis